MKSVILEARLQATLNKFLEKDVYVDSLKAWVRFSSTCSFWHHIAMPILVVTVLFHSSLPDSPLSYFTCAARTLYRCNELSSDL